MTTIKELRQRAELKAEQVAVHLGISDSTIANWEQGRTMPRMRLDQFSELCSLYHCTIEELHQAALESQKQRGK
jgi:putative transcriptional regulator